LDKSRDKRGCFSPLRFKEKEKLGVAGQRRKTNRGKEENKRYKNIESPGAVAKCIGDKTGEKKKIKIIHYK